MKGLRNFIIWYLILFSTSIDSSLALQHNQAKVVTDAGNKVTEVEYPLNEKVKYVNGVLQKGFLNPPDSSRPGVYWYFMDGNISKQAITADLESMKKVGIAHVLFLEVNVGIPRGKVDFMSEEWLNLFTHIVRESERLGITITLGVGPGWTGSGGPWVSGAQSMKHLKVYLNEFYSCILNNERLNKLPRSRAGEVLLESHLFSRSKASGN